MNEENTNNRKDRKGLIFKIIFSAGVLISLCYLFIPASSGDIVENEEITNMFNAFTGTSFDSQIHFVQMLFGHGADNPITMSPVLLDLLVLILPIAVMLAAVVIIWIFEKSKLGLIFGLASSVMFLGIDLYLLFTGTSCFGVYLNMAGIVIAILGLLLFYIDIDDKEDESYEVAGVITCKTGTFAGSIFEIPDKVVIGKDASKCNIVLQNRTISGVHCIIRYVPETDTYTVKDISRNGTFFADGKPLAKNYEMQVKRGTKIYMGDPRETFYLD